MLPLPTFMVDESGVILACNESFAEQAGVPHTLLVSREWWQAFAERSASEARATQRSIIEGNQARGTALLALAQADGGISQLTLVWHRLTEPATRRLVWIFAVTAWQHVDTTAPLSDRFDEFTSSEIAALVADEVEASTVEVSSALVELAREMDASGAADRWRERVGEARAAAARLKSTSAGLRRYVEELRTTTRTIRPDEILANALASLDPAVRERAVRVSNEARAELPRNEPDPQRLIAHLIANALRHSPHGEPVEVRAYDEPGFVCFEIRDRGRGLAPDSLARANEPVFARSSSRGAGGIAAARGIARALGGSLRFVNDPGGGSLAVLALPTAAVPPRVAASNPPPPNGPLSGRTVLIVDDELALARSMVRLFSNAGATTTHAGTVADAFRSLDEHSFDAIVTDLQLPDGDGLSIARRVSEQNPRTVVIAVSGQTDPALAELARTMGAHSLLNKPFDAGKLLALVSELVSRDTAT